MKTLSLAAAAAALLAEPALAAPAPSMLQPSSPWIVQSADESCRVLRSFGTGGDEVLLSFEQAVPRAPMTMMATGGRLRVPTLKARSAATADFRPIDLAHFVADGAATTSSGKDVLIWSSVGFRPSGHVRSAPVTRARRGGGGNEPAGIVTLAVQKARRDEERGRERAANSLDLQIGRGGAPVRLMTGPMRDPMNRLRSCMNRQLSAWGLDPAVEETIVKPPTPQTLPTSWLEFKGASRISLKRDELSPVTVRLIVDKDGKVSSCKADAPRDGKAFEDALCANVARRAIIIPARAENGQTVPSYLVTTIRRSGGR